MKKGIFITLILASIAYQGWSQETYRHQISSAPETARYEIVQSELAIRNTFKIDKITGEVFQLVKDDDEVLWE